MNLPITLITYTLSHKVVSQLKLYLYLKYVCSGHFKVEQRSVHLGCEYLGWKSVKTFKKNLNWLISHDWLAYNTASQNCRVISLARICHKLNVETKTGVIFQRRDFKKFRPFLYAAVITWSIRKRNWIKLRQPELKKGCSRKSMPDPIHEDPIQAMPNRYLAKILALDYSTISRYKSAACRAGYITSSKQYENTGLSADYIDFIRAAFPEENDNYVALNGTIQHQLPDRITSTIHLKHRNLRPP